jgi:hypothetical protein
MVSALPQQRFLHLLGLFKGEDGMLIGAASEAAIFRLPLTRNHCRTTTSISATGDSYHKSNHRTDDGLPNTKKLGNKSQKNDWGRKMIVHVQ